MECGEENVERNIRTNPVNPRERTPEDDFRQVVGELEDDANSGADSGSRPSEALRRRLAAERLEFRNRRPARHTFVAIVPMVIARMRSIRDVQPHGFRVCRSSVRIAKLDTTTGRRD